MIELFVALDRESVAELLVPDGASISSLLVLEGVFILKGLLTDGGVTVAELFVLGGQSGRGRGAGLGGRRGRLHASAGGRGVQARVARVGGALALRFFECLGLGQLCACLGLFLFGRQVGDQQVQHALVHVSSGKAGEAAGAAGDCEFLGFSEYDALSSGAAFGTAHAAFTVPGAGVDLAAGEEGHETAGVHRVGGVGEFAVELVVGRLRKFGVVRIAVGVDGLLAFVHVFLDEVVVAAEAAWGRGFGGGVSGGGELGVEAGVHKRGGFGKLARSPGGAGGDAEVLEPSVDGAVGDIIGLGDIGVDVVADVDFDDGVARLLRLVGHDHAIETVRFEEEVVHHVQVGVGAIAPLDFFTGVGNELCGNGDCHGHWTERIGDCAKGQSGSVDDVEDW